MAKEECLILDGYNIINAWPRLNRIKEDNLEFARLALIDIFMEYQAYTGQRLIIVFDAQNVKGGQEKREYYGPVEVMYTREGETADSCIERLAYELSREGYTTYVATSDWAEQQVVLGSGAYRITPRELLADLTEVKAKIDKKTKGHMVKDKRETIDHRLQDDVREALERIRRGQT